MKIVIIGAGLTGLSAAYHLEQFGHDEIEIYEKEAIPGGLLRSERIDGFTFDYTGHFIHINNEYFKGLIEQLSSPEELEQVVRSSAIYTHDRFNPYPFQMNLYGLPSDVITECITGFINRKQSRKKPTTFKEWVLKHFGSGIGKHFFFPFQQKILATPLNQIEPSWTGRFVPKTNLHDMIKRSIEPPSEKTVGYNSHFFYPKHGGIDWLINKLKDAISTPIQTGQQVVAIDAARKQITFNTGKVVSYDHLITSMPLNHLLKGMQTHGRGRLAQAGEKLSHNSVLNFNIGINKPDIGKHHWYYVPQIQYPFYRVGCWHRVNKEMAPAGKSALYGELSFIPGKTSLNTVKKRRDASVDMLTKIFGFSKNDIIVEKDLLLNHAYVIYDHWRKKNIDKILSHLQSEYSIDSVGRFGEWKYSSMQEGILDGRNAALLALPKEKREKQESFDTLTKNIITAIHTKKHERTS